jgi:hypothetical protein
MDDLELKKLWQEQRLPEPAPSAADLMAAVHRKQTLLRRCLAARDLRELLACAFVIIVFVYMSFTVYRGPVSRVGVVVIIGSTAFIAGKLVYIRRTTPPAPPGATVVESLRAELALVRAQSRALGSVLWWYLLPLTIGLAIATWGLPRPIYGKILATLFFIALAVIVHWLNQWARARQLLPLETQLESLLHSAETGAPVEETHAGDLRPIVVSMAAAERERVRPVEFKVAFWQIAVWGEVGFVGMWFFYTLGQTLDHPDANEAAVASVAQTIPAQEAKRYSAVARTVVDRLNAGDYAAVQRLYNPGMARAFPPQATVDFYTSLTARFGHVEKFDGPTGDGHRGWIAYRLSCERGVLTMSLALDADDRIAGIYFRPPAWRFANIASLARQIFRGPRLVWIVPFFLAGLLYSWILQKGTERAVGISALGVHLRRGQTLVLWDEIKDVRPFRFLYVRNLWLIRASGEKTLMHWTPLERHSDLKAAVEEFAPVDHPLRGFLSLLR